MLQPVAISTIYAFTTGQKLWLMIRLGFLEEVFRITVRQSGREVDDVNTKIGFGNL